MRIMSFDIPKLFFLFLIDKKIIITPSKCQQIKQTNSLIFHSI